MSEGRVRFSINLEEDFDLYGIDPNENLDDWSFLDAKPEPIPEKTQEEKELFEQLLKPTITEESVTRDIHARLKNLISETDNLIKSSNRNRVTPEISTPAEDIKPSTPEIEKERANTPEFIQANRVKNIVRSLIESTEKAEDITGFIEEVTKSDKIDPNTIDVPDSALSVPVARLLPQVKEAEEEVTSGDKNDQQKDESLPPKPTVSFLSRYTKKQSEQKSVMQSLDETERLSQKFKEERKKREEESQKEQERKQQEIEEKSRKFIESLQKEQERREKMPQQIADFAKKLEEVMNRSVTPQKPTIVVDLLSEKQKNVKTKSHESKTFASNLGKALAQKLVDLNKDKKKRQFGKAAIKLAIFFKFAIEKTLAKKGKLFRQKHSFNVWHKKHELKKQKIENKVIEKKRNAVLEKAKRTYCAVRLQRVIRLFIKQKEIENKRRIAEEEAKAKKLQAEKERKHQENEKKNADALEAVRKRIEEQFPTKEKQKQSKVVHYDIPEIDDNALDDSWIRSHKKADEDSDFEEFLNGLDDHQPPIPIPLPKQDIIVESGSTPIRSSDDSFLSKYLKKDEHPANEEDEIARIRAEIEAKVKKNKIAKEKEKDPQRQSMNSSFTPSSPGSIRSSIESNRSSITSNQMPPGANTQNQPQEGYDLSPETAALMRRAKQRYHKTNYKDEAPVDKFKRLYGIHAQQPQHEGSNANKVNPMPFRQNNTRTRRLQKLQRAWFDGERQAELERENHE